MNKVKKVIAATMIACTFAIPGLAQADEMSMPEVNYTGIETMMKDGMELVPLRQVAEGLGFTVTWDGEKRAVTLAKMSMGQMGMDDKMMEMPQSIMLVIDSKTMKVGQKEEMLMYAPTIIEDKTYVSKQFVEMYLANTMDMQMK